MRVDTEAGMSISPPWLDASVGLPDYVPVQVRPWILLNTSMTQTLHETFGMDIHVRVLLDAPGQLLADESGLLATKGSMGHVREVVLHDSTRTLVAARTVYRSRNSILHRELASLGTRPLGELLFAHGQPRYLQRQFVKLDKRMPLFTLVQRATGEECDSCWARRTVFLFKHQPLLVTEIFLPMIFQ